MSEKTKKDILDARYVPVEVDCIWAFQVDFDHLERLAACMELLAEYGYRLSARVMRSSAMLAVVVDGADGPAKSVGHGDWIVFTDGQVKTVSQQEFSGAFKKADAEAER